MHTPDALIVACWLVLFLYWVISSFDTKRYAHRAMRSWGARLCIIVLLLIVLNLPAVSSVFAQWNALFPEWARWLGVIVCALGVALALWARVHLGRNWGMPMSLKQDAELVTTGPYAYIRHPIYTGLLLAMAGTALVSFPWIVALVVFAGYFSWSALTEERIMLGEFPAQYAEYMARTWRLVPFLW